MALARLRRRILGRRSVRARIALACAGLFLVIVGSVRRRHLHGG